MDIGMTIDQFLAQIESRSPPAPLAEVSNLELELGAELPKDYRHFLISCNGGYVGGGLWFTGKTPSGALGDAGVHHIGGFREEPCFSLYSAREVYEGRLPRGLLWIMDDPFGNAICVCLSGPRRGGIYFWDHEQEPDPRVWSGDVETAGNVLLLANSFTQFVAGLRPIHNHDA